MILDIFVYFLLIDEMFYASILEYIRQIFKNAAIVVNIVTTLIIKHYIDEQIEISHVIVLIIGS